MLKGELREKIRKNQRKMLVRGRSILTLMRIRIERSLAVRRKV